MKALLLALLLACSPEGICEAPCPTATGQEEHEGGIYCWCGSAAGRVFLWKDLADSCEQPRSTWETAIAGIKGGCPGAPGGGGRTR